MFALVDRGVAADDGFPAGTAYLLRTADVPRSVTQLVLGTYMVWDARRKRLCQRYFESGGI